VSVNPRAVVVAKVQGVAAEGQAPYDADCASCHGADGKGTPLTVHDGITVNLVNVSRFYAADEFLTLMIDGVPDTTMGGYANLSDQELANLYAYLRGLPR
jgi:mono/diheme cytochrome c family protein